MLNPIPKEMRKGLICHRCGSDKSVKYWGKDGKPYCNGCIMVVDYINRGNK